MNREAIERTNVAVGRILIHAPVAERFGPLAKLHKDEPSYGSQAMDGGSRSTDSTSSVERAVLRPDPIQARLESFASNLAMAAAALERASVDARWLESSEGPVERANSVPICVACNGPSLPRPKSHAGEGPFCENDYRSWTRVKVANPSCTLKQWLNTREKHHAA
jgi:hypothetical protein